jgi:hypothetical protein
MRRRGRERGLRRLCRRNLFSRSLRRRSLRGRESNADRDDQPVADDS